MNAVAGAVAPLTAYREALLAASGVAPAVSVVDAGLAPEPGPSGFAVRFPARYVSLGLREAEVVAAALARSDGGTPVFVGASVPFLLDDAFASLVRSLVVPRRNVKLVGVPATTAPVEALPVRAVRDDVGTMRSVPGMTVAVPADGRTTRAVVLALAGHAGPAYVRLPPPDAPEVTDGTFAVGRAHELRAGSDLTIVALGVMLSRAVEVAGELARVGISARVLDAASVKPFDEAAVLRAARDTGAILVAEAGPLATGIGTLVAAMTAENYPVPVRRLGVPDVWSGGEGAGGAGDACLSVERLTDEAWELLRLRGKAT